MQTAAFGKFVGRYAYGKYGFCTVPSEDPVMPALMGPVVVGNVPDPAVGVDPLPPSAIAPIQCAFIGQQATWPPSSIAQKDLLSQQALSSPR